jgi:hypothetical protein
MMTTTTTNDCNNSNTTNMRMSPGGRRRLDSRAGSRTAPKHVARRRRHRLWRALFCGSRYPRYLYTHTHTHTLRTYTCTVYTHIRYYMLYVCAFVCVCVYMYMIFMRLCCSFGHGAAFFFPLWQLDPITSRVRADGGVCNENNDYICRRAPTPPPYIYI